VLRDQEVAAFLADTEAFWSDIEERADQAASLAAPPATHALAALVRAAIIARDFQMFCTDFLPTAERPTFPATLYSGWLATLRQPMPDWWFDAAGHPDAIAEDVAAHPGLAVEWGNRKDVPVWGRPRNHGMLTSPSTLDEPDLAREYSAGTEGIDRALLTPVDWSDYDADRIHRDAFYSPTPAASRMLGHQASPEEILSMVESDSGQWLVAAVRDEIRRTPRPPAGGTVDRRIADPSAFTAGTVLAGLAAEILHQTGYRHTDPLRPQLMSDPAGRRVDLHAVVTDALTAAEGMERLRRLLLAGSIR
jgi:hypothetical protein